MIQSLNTQIQLLVKFLKAYWFLVGIGAFMVYIATPRMELIADEFLGEVYQEGLAKREEMQIHKIDSLNRIQLFRIDSMNHKSDSLNMIHIMNYIDSTNTLQIVHLDSLADKSVVKKMNQILADTIPYYENGKEAGYWIIYLKPDLTPIVNKYNSIFNDPKK